VTLLGLGDADEPDLRGPGHHAARTGHCVCGRPIWDPVSLHYGIGPDCRRRLGIVSRRPVRITGVPAGWDCEGQADLLEEIAWQ
jgi:hypothetical protein